MRKPFASLRVLPDALILGAQRAGSCSLYHALKAHPAFVPPSLNHIGYFSTRHGRGLAWYRSHFPLAAYAALVRAARGGFATADNSPYYLFHPLAPGRASRVVPGARLVALLRNPVDRAYSHYWHARRIGVEELTFEDALDRESRRLEGEEAKLLADSGYYSHNHQHYSYLARGLYAAQLRRWLEFYPRERLLVLRAEDFHRDPAGTLQTTLRFLGLPEVPLKAGPIRRHCAGEYPPMDARTRERLSRHFEPHNRELYRQLGVDFGW